MDKKRLSEVLSRLQFLRDQQERPTLRETGLTETEFQELADEGLAEFGDRGSGETLDRYVFFDLKPKALVLIHSQQIPSAPPARVVSHTPKAPISETIGRGLASGLWDLAKVSFGVALGWYLKKWFP